MRGILLVRKLASAKSQLNIGLSIAIRIACGQIVCASMIVQLLEGEASHHIQGTLRITRMG
jgi:hypothetical protein